VREGRREEGGGGKTARERQRGGTDRGERDRQREGGKTVRERQRRGRLRGREREGGRQSEGKALSE
jgi:hypothetical protein